MVFVHTSLGKQFFSVYCIMSYDCSFPCTSEQIQENTDPGCVISVDCPRGFCTFTLLESSACVALFCFFYGCIVVYPVLRKPVLTRNSYICLLFFTYKFRFTSMWHMQ